MHVCSCGIRALAVVASFAIAHVAAAAPATHYRFTLPDPVPFYTSVQVHAYAVDDADQTDTGYAGTASVTGSDPAMSVVGPTTFAGGELVFSVAFKTAGVQWVTLTDNATPSITGSASTTMPPGPPVRFSVEGAAPVAGDPVTFTVNARDLFNNLATSYSGTAHMTSSDGQATLPADFAISNGTGSAQATFRTSGNQWLAATDPAATAMTGNGVFAVAPGAAAHFNLTLPATVDPGVTFAFQVMAIDAFDNANASYAGTLHFTSSDAGATLPADATLTNGQGTFPATLQVAHATTSITATDTADASITGTGQVATTPVTLQSFVVD
jgi:hypothetical protein